jgi:hypothetical protein
MFPLPRLYPWPPLLALLALLGLHLPARALDRPDITFPIFQFPANQMPRIDGQTDDWSIVPEHYIIGMDQLRDASGKHPAPDPANLDVRMRVGWVKGLNRLYFLYEAYDDFWHFSSLDHHNDTLEIMVDGDASGGPFGDPRQRSFWTPERVGASRSELDPRLTADEWKWAIHGIHAQNYHIFTPAGEKDWAMAWGAATWIKNLPFANSASSYTFRPGENGRLVLEFWITPFDHAAPEGPERAVESLLHENKIIGLGWIIIDYDDPSHRRNNGFWTLSRHRSSYGDATELPAFRLMPLEPALHRPIEAHWRFTVVDPSLRRVAFIDESLGEATSWRWDFGDGNHSTEQHPVHAYKQPGSYVVVLEVSGPSGLSRRAKVWDVQLR